MSSVIIVSAVLPWLGNVYSRCMKSDEQGRDYRPSARLEKLAQRIHAKILDSRQERSGFSWEYISGSVALEGIFMTARHPPAVFSNGPRLLPRSASHISHFIRIS